MVRADRGARYGGLRRAAAGCGGGLRRAAAAAAGCGGLAASTRKRPFFLVGLIKLLKERPRAIPKKWNSKRASVLGLYLGWVSVHTKNHYVCCTERGGLEKAGSPDRHPPDPRTTTPRHSRAKISCPLLVLLSRQAQSSASSSRCSPCVLVSSRKPKGLHSSSLPAIGRCDLIDLAITSERDPVRKAKLMEIEKFGRKKNGARAGARHVSWES